MNVVCAVYDVKRKEVIHIAIYHCSIKIISRGAGRTAVGAAAYRSAEKLTAGYDGLIHDYTRKRGVVYKEVMLPEHVPETYKDREVLWNAVEKIEKSKNAQLSREIEIAIPKELPPDKRLQLVREYCQKIFVDAGMCADICIHKPQKGEGQENPHAHVMLTMRPLDEDGTWGAKSKKEYILDKNGEKIYDKKKRQYKCRKINTVDWNDKEKVEVWRSAWADISNRYLAEADLQERIDHRSFKRQGIDLIPTIHLGVQAAQMERRGVATELGDINRQIEKENQLLKVIKEQTLRLGEKVKLLFSRLYERQSVRKEAESNTEFLIEKILQSKGVAIKYTTHSNNFNRKLFDLKASARAYSVVQEYGISAYDELQKIYDQINGKRVVSRNKIKILEKDIREHEELLKYAQDYKEFKPVYDKATKVWNERKFREEHRSELTLFAAARDYLDNHLEKGSKLQIKKWQQELRSLRSEQLVLNQEYKGVRKEYAEVSNTKRHVDMLVKEQELERSVLRASSKDNIR